ncbi:MAG: hypothetical protein RLZZ205_1196 [Bacteroidota bacterium]
MFTTALAAMATFQMVLLSKNDIPLLGIIVISFFSRYVEVFGHIEQNNEIVR